MNKKIRKKKINSFLNNLFLDFIETVHTDFKRGNYNYENFTEKEIQEIRKNLINNYQLR